MKFWRDRRSHAWVDRADPIVTERLGVVPITPELDGSYLALLPHLIGRYMADGGFGTR